MRHDHIQLTDRLLDRIDAAMRFQTECKPSAGFSREERLAPIALRNAAKELLKALSRFDWKYDSNIHDAGRLDLELAIERVQELIP